MKQSRGSGSASGIEITLDSQAETLFRKHRWLELEQVDQVFWLINSKWGAQPRSWRQGIAVVDDQERCSLKLS